MVFGDAPAISRFNTATLFIGPLDAAAGATARMQLRLQPEKRLMRLAGEKQSRGILDFLTGTAPLAIPALPGRRRFSRETGTRRIEIKITLD